MGRISDDFACLLEAPTAVEADLARGLLDGAGIPCLLHGRDADFAEFGFSAHVAMTRPSLYVPQAALEEARALLASAWGPDTASGDQKHDSYDSEGGGSPA